MKMKVLLFVSLLSAASAQLQAALSVLPDLAFFFEDGKGAVYDVQGTNFTELATNVSLESYFPGLPPSLTASAYLLTDDRSEVITTFFRGRRVYMQTTDRAVQLNTTISGLFVNGPSRVDAAFPILDVNNSVIGVKFILRRLIFECGEIGSACIRTPLRQYAPGLSEEFWRDGFRVKAALALPNDRVVLIKETRHAILHNGMVEQENPNLDVFTGWF